MPQPMPLPPVGLVRELFDYNEQTGILKWKVSRTNRVKKGDIVGTLTNEGYLKFLLTHGGKRRQYCVHRIAWLYVTGEDPGDALIDHANGDRTDNSFGNLRKASFNENLWNSKIRINNASGFKGVHWHKRQRKWIASVSSNGKRIHLGSFDTPELAHMAYCKAAAELHGEFARGA